MLHMYNNLDNFESTCSIVYIVKLKNTSSDPSLLKGTKRVLTHSSSPIPSAVTFPSSVQIQ